MVKQLLFLFGVIFHTAIGMASDGAFATSLIEEVDWNRALKTDALLLSQDGQLIVEEYSNGYRPDQKHRLWSITKSVGSLVVGMAVKEGRMKLSDSLCKHLRTEDGVRPTHCPITIKDLLFWQSGVEWTETDFGVRPDRSNLFHGLYGQGQSNLASYFLSLPIIARPGAKWKYTTAESHLLWKILRRVYSESDYKTLLWTRLLQPLGIEEATFEKDGSGTYLGGSHLYLRPRDLHRIGQFVLEEYEKPERLPVGWMQEMTTAQQNAVFTRWTDRKGETPAIGAGHWWVNQPVAAHQEQPWVQATNRTFAAFGVFGQMMILVPEEKVIILRLANDVVGSLLDRPRFVHRMLREVRERTKVDKVQGEVF